MVLKKYIILLRICRKIQHIIQKQTIEADATLSPLPETKDKKNRYRQSCPQHIGAETKWPPFRRRHFQIIFLYQNFRISNEISLKFIPKGPINNIPALVLIMAWYLPGDKPLSETMMVSLLTHIYTSLGLNEIMPSGGLYGEIRAGWF